MVRDRDRSGFAQASCFSIDQSLQISGAFSYNMQIKWLQRTRCGNRIAVRMIFALVMSGQITAPVRHLFNEP